MNFSRVSFPNHLSDIRKMLPKLLNILEEGRINEWYAFVWLEEKKTIQCVTAINQSVSSNFDRGIVFRVMIDGKSYEKSTNTIEFSFLIQMVKNFKNELETLYPKGTLLQNRSFTPLAWRDENLKTLSLEIASQIPENLNSETEVHFSPKCVEDPYVTSITQMKDYTNKIREELIEKSKKYVDKNNLFKPLTEVKVALFQSIVTNVFVDREKNMSQTLPLTRLYAVGINSLGQSARSDAGGMGGFELAVFSEDEKNEVALRPLQLALAKKLNPGRYMIITGPDVTGTIAHEAFGHTQEGDTWMKGRSIACDLHANKIKVGNELASIVNHPSIFSMENCSFGTNGSYYFDHEGQLARVQTILEKGFLSTPMTDLTSSIRLNVPRTANGKRENWSRPLMTRQTNTYFTPGDRTFEELLKMVPYGFLARWSYGGMEDPKGGSLTAGTAYLEEIKNGKLTGEIYLGPSGGHIELSDPVFTLLNKIIAKSKSVNSEQIPLNMLGGCGKYHKESVPAGSGGPYILWEEINCG